ncbi:MAG: winged helix-turn-helix transcriptional regulator [Achromobacter sp.]|uniref:winged helix-turn-helix domain-containing protein n=1 Tax=Achromobacter sp. TaxID=134375 RepID=UPI001AD41DEE|nr:winged helix-turn-helix domain-containing protein [Achromobacter sp.]MBN9636896.1 winged helix-turn-helix transcriptional regulator [Achromobacter sp.]
MNEKYLDYIARLDLKAYEYRILLLLAVKPYTPTQIVNELGVMKQNVNRYIQSLKGLGLIEVDRIEGRNKFYKSVTDIKKLKEFLPGQTTMKI